MAVFKNLYPGDRFTVSDAPAYMQGFFVKIKKRPNPHNEKLDANAVRSLDARGNDYDYIWFNSDQPVVFLPLESELPRGQKRALIDMPYLQVIDRSGDNLRLLDNRSGYEFFLTQGGYVLDTEG
jgi:hypothetical protein